MELEFKSTLLREKFTIRDIGNDLSDTPPVIAMSNRMVLPLVSDTGEPSETFIVRAQNMHSCVRLCAAIAKEYYDRGSLMGRVTPFRWENLWSDVIKGYEKDWNPDIWTAIYYKGRVIYEDGSRHPFLDIIEQCDAASGQSYAESVKFAEKAFQQAGKPVKIQHDSNVALIVSIKPEEAKCGVILRGANKKTTFNFTAKKKPSGDSVRVATILTLCSTYLEGVQLAFNVGMTNKKRSAELMEKFSDEDRKGRRGAERLINLTTAVETVERKYFFHYRPDQPNFQTMVREAEDFALHLLKPEIQAKIERGELSPRDWIF